MQTRLAIALLGDETQYTGLARSSIYRWFSDPAARRIYPEADHELHSRAFAADLRAAYAREGAGSRAGLLVKHLLETSPDFARHWSEHEIGVRHGDFKRIVHSELGVLELHCQVLYDLDQSQALLVFTATPGTPTSEKLQLLSVIGEQSLNI